jgi:transposase
MDGARYHKRRIEAIPSSSSRKQVMQDWLISKGIAFGDQETKAMLYEKIKANRQRVSYACVEIAREYGHALQYTPPYHCELQPIEGVWGVAKNQVGAEARPDDTAITVRNRLLHAFEGVNKEKNILLSLWRKSVAHCREYWDLDDSDGGVDDDNGYVSDESDLDLEFENFQE